MDESLTALLAASNLAHVGSLLPASSTLAGLEEKLEADGKVKFMNHLKTLGFTALKDRQGLANSIAKAKRERAAGGGASGGDAAAAPRKPKHKACTGVDADCDLMGTRRGAHKTPGVCAQFARVLGANENDITAFNCALCGYPATEHEDLGPAPIREDTSYELDLSTVMVDGRGAVGQLAAQKQSTEPAVSSAHLEMFEAGTDPLAQATMASSSSVPAATAAALNDDPLGLSQMESSTVPDDPLGLAGMMASVTPPSGAPAPSAPPPTKSNAPPPSGKADPLEEARANGVDVAALERLAAAGQKEELTAMLKAAGYKTGGRLKMEALLLANASPAPTPPPPLPVTSGPPYQVDFFGMKRGACLADPSCKRYEAKVIAFNHCSAGADVSALNCVRCGHDPSKHENLGTWQPGEPMLVNELGQRFKTLQVGGSKR